MDLLSIVQAVWRHKFVAAPVILLTALGAFYVMAIKPPTYNATESFLLLSPSTPTPAQIASHPKAPKANAGNPYVNFGDLQIVADAVIELINSSQGQQALVAAGADPQYQVTLSTDFGNPPIVDVTGVGTTAQAAIKTANLVTQAAIVDLRHLQLKQGVSPLYLIKATELVQPQQATQTVSGKLRTLIAVLGLGLIMLFVVVSVSDVAQKRRADRRAEADMALNDQDYPRQSAPAARTADYHSRLDGSRYPAARPREDRPVAGQAAGRRPDDGR